MATSCDSVARPWLVMIAGGVRSGKSTLARELAQRYAGTRVAFGDIVRQRTAALGLPGERRFWQQVGEEWVARDPDGLCDMVMTAAQGQSRVILDGLRHMQIYRLLLARAGTRMPVLVFVDTAADVRRRRLLADKLDEQAVEQILDYSTEGELPLLRRAADLVVDGTQDAATMFASFDDLIGGRSQNRH